MKNAERSGHTTQSVNKTSKLRRARPTEQVRIVLLSTREAGEVRVATSIKNVLQIAFAGAGRRRVVLFPGAQISRGHRWPSSRDVVEEMLADEGAAGLFEARTEGVERAYYAFDPNAGGRLDVTIHQTFATAHEANENKVRELLDACRTGQRTIVVGGIPIGLLVCGENNVLSNVQAEGNRVAVRHLGGSKIFTDTRVVLNGAHTRMGSWGKLERRFEWLSRRGGWAFFNTNINGAWGRSELRAYFDGELRACGRHSILPVRTTKIQYLGTNATCRALVIDVAAEQLLPWK